MGNKRRPHWVQWLTSVINKWQKEETVSKEARRNASLWFRSTRRVYLALEDLWLKDPGAGRGGGGQLSSDPRLNQRLSWCHLAPLRS